MKKFLSLALMTTLSVMLAFGVTLAAGGDQAYGVGTVTIAGYPNTSNDIEMVLNYKGEQIGEWTKEAAYLGDITFSQDITEASQSILIRNNKTVTCPNESCPPMEFAKYSMRTADYAGDPSTNQDMALVKVTEVLTDKVIFEGPLSQMDTLTFNVGYTYVDENGNTLNIDVTELLVEYTTGAPVPHNTYMEYTFRVQELPPQ